MSILVIHIGAGCHSTHLGPKYRKLLKSALSKDLIRASKVIEKNPLTNTGYGSSLDSEGNASCDCTIAKVKNGVVVNVLSLTNITDCVNPTLACQQVLAQLDTEYSGFKGQMGLLKPSLLDFRVAKARCNGIPSDSLVLNRALSIYTKYMEHESSLQNLGNEGGFEGNNKTTFTSINANSADHDFCEDVQDTVGFLQLDTVVEMATSSGGAFLHPPGRISCAGVYGAGIGYSRDQNIEVFCLCSGNGDDIMKMGLASYVSDRMAQHLLQMSEWPELGKMMVGIVQKRSALFQLAAVDSNLNPIVYVGVLAVVRDAIKTRLVFCHSTESFYFGYRSHIGMETVLSRHDGVVGTFVCGEYKL